MEEAFERPTARRHYTKTIIGVASDGRPIILPVTPPPTAKEMPDEIVSGDVIYKLENLLGEGGMGAVWKSRCEYTAGPGENDDVIQYAALKFVRKIAQMPELQERLIQEAKLIAQLKHDNIVPFLGWHYRPEDQNYFVVMEYMEGMDLDGLLWMHHIDAEGAPKTVLNDEITKLPDPITGFILFQILNGLAYAHNYEFEIVQDGKKQKQKGVAHRDISPGNVLIKLDEGSVKLGDFGIAVPTSDLEGKEGSRVTGKIPYMSPEIANPAATVDKRTDLYSLGVVLYEMLTGLRPNDPYLQEKNDIAVFYGTQEMSGRKLVPPHHIVKNMNRGLSNIACRLLAEDPDHRYKDAAEARDAVLKCIYSLGVGPTKDSLRDYMQLRKDTDNLPSKGFSNLSFMNKWWCSRVPAIFQQYRLTRYARKRLERNENPARV